MFNENVLEEYRNKNNEYVTGDPFKHIVIDGLIKDSVLDEVLDCYPKQSDIRWAIFRDPLQVKLACNDLNIIPDKIKNVLHGLNDSKFLSFLEDLTGIKNVIADPHFIGGGMHQIMPNGKLEIHADFNKHPITQLDRRVNVLLYLNKDWKEEYGGHLELWNKDLTKCTKKILPVYNRMVIFSTTSTSFHGHPKALTCPEGTSRKSLAWYYYSDGRPQEEINPSHSTLFKGRDII